MLLFPLIHPLFHLQKHIHVATLALSGALHSAICNMQFFSLHVFLFKHLVDITKGGLCAIETGLTLYCHFTFALSACTMSGCLDSICIPLCLICFVCLVGG